MRIPLVRSRNFNSHDIARDAIDVPVEILYITAYAHGCVQMVRDAAHRHFGDRFKGINVTSSNRAGYNQNIPLAASNSHHIFRLGPNKELHCALDLDPIGITTLELFNFMKANFKGEIGHEPKRNVVHYAPVPMEDEAWTDNR